MMRIGIRLPLRLLEQGVGTLLDAVAKVHAAGLDHVTVGDHVSFRGGAGSDGLVQASAVAASDLEVHTGIYLLPLGHPVTVARFEAIGRCGEVRTLLLAELGDAEPAVLTELLEDERG